MQIRFTKLSDVEHRLAITRNDGSTDNFVLNSRSFLRHDLAHFITESCVGLNQGFWGLVAQGAPLNGDGMGGPELQLAEALAGPVQILMRDNAATKQFEQVLAYVLPDRDCSELASNMHEQSRKLQGHWRATPYGETMEIEWQEDAEN